MRKDDFFEILGELDDDIVLALVENGTQEHCRLLWKDERIVSLALAQQIRGSPSNAAEGEKIEP